MLFNATAGIKKPAVPVMLSKNRKTSTFQYFLEKEKQLPAANVKKQRPNLY
jgi:hypothetical protein